MNHSSFISLKKYDSSDKKNNSFYLFNNDFMLDGEYLLISYEINENEETKFFDNIIINNKYRVIIDEFNNSEKIISLLYISAFILVEDLITNKHLFLFNPFYYEVNKYFVKYYSSFTTALNWDDIGLKDDSNYFYNKGYNKYYRNIDEVKGINLIKIYINDNLLTLNLTNINDDDLTKLIECIYLSGNYYLLNSINKYNVFKYNYKKI